MELMNNFDVDITPNSFHVKFFRQSDVCDCDSSKYVNLCGLVVGTFNDIISIWIYVIFNVWIYVIFNVLV